MQTQLFTTEWGGVSNRRWFIDYHRVTAWGWSVRFFRLFGVTLMVANERPVE